MKWHVQHESEFSFGSARSSWRSGCIGVSRSERLDYPPDGVNGVKA